MGTKLFFLLSCTLLVSCSISDDDLKTGWWKYGGGQHIGDILTFNDSNISNDTIYKNEIAIGIIVDREESLFGLTSRKIWIQPLIKSTNPIEENFKLINENFPNNNEKYINPYPENLGVYHQK